MRRRKRRIENILPLPGISNNGGVSSVSDGKLVIASASVTGRFPEGSRKDYPMPTPLRLLRDLTLACLLFSLAGCLINSSSSVNETGRLVSDSTLQQIEPGKTTQEWLVATLGEPTSRSPVRSPGNVEILGYSHERVRRSSGSVFLLFGSSSTNTNRSTTFFEVTDGVVSRFWTEG